MLQKNFEIDNIEEPKVYMRDGKPCYFDIAKKILRIKTPEETVRQKLIRFLNSVLKVPIEAISTEVPLSHYLKGAQGRMDLDIFARADKIVAVIECKAPDIALNDDVFDQVDRYARNLNIPIAGMTNGHELKLFYYNKSTYQYESVTCIPLYDKMCNPLKLKTIRYKPPKFKRFNLSKPLNTIYNYACSEGILGEATPKEYSPYIVNLDNCLCDTSVRLEKVQINGISFVKDVGIRLSRFGNAGGGALEGRFRSFMVLGDNDNIEIYSFAFWGLPEIHNDRFRQKGNTSFVIAVDDFDKHHNSLELCFNKYVDITKSPVEFYHDGNITIGNQGAAKRSELLDYVNSRNSTLIRNGSIFLGTVDFTKPLYVTDDDIKILLCNLITYAKLRENFRKSKRKP